MKLMKAWYCLTRGGFQRSWLWLACALNSACVARLDEWDASGRGALGTEVVAEPSDTATSAGTDVVTSAPFTPAVCANGVRDGSETGVDCGGDLCPACGEDWSCEVDDDCQSRLCFGVCLALNCGNGLADTTETDLDCGGPCAPCADGRGCYSGNDCESGVCNDGQCISPLCDDGVFNGSETDLDCGGPACYGCETGLACVDNDDCVSDICFDGTCVELGCADGISNGSETDVDCGGPDCAPCTGDARCDTPSDCASGICVETASGVQRCSDARCDDAVHNGRETDLDCGGPDCSPCNDGAACNSRIDCVSLVCDRESSTCSPAACDDGVTNGEESDVDCGGSCGECADGAQCGDDVDCASGLCLDARCRAASCTDGRTNGSESDVDCGGECPACGLGDSCSTPTDCRSGACSGVCDPGAADRPCAIDDECISGTCMDGVCARAAAGSTCGAGTECRSGHCSAEDRCSVGALGTPCVTASDCASDRCEAGACAPSRFAISTDGGTDTSVVTFKTRIQANAEDPLRQWRDIALLYFFTPEAHDDFLSRYYDGPDFSVWDARFFAVSMDGAQWAMIWRAAPGNVTAVPTAVTTFDYQLRNDPWTSFDASNDFSFRGSGFAANPRVAVCQRLEGRWVHTQGDTPSTFSSPCDLVVDSCAETTVYCDPLQRTQ